MNIGTRQIVHSKLTKVHRYVRLLPSFKNAPSTASTLALLTSMDSQGFLPLHYSAAAGDTDITTLICEIFSFFKLDRFLNIHDRSQSFRSPLHWAAMNGNYSTVKTLIQHGATIDITDNEGHTPLHLALSAFYHHDDDTKVSVRRGLTFIVKYLVSVGANTNCYDMCGVSPLHIAAEMGNEEMVLYLLEEGGAFVGITDNENETALFYAVRGQHRGVVKVLIDFKIDVQWKNEEGETALDVMRVVGDKTMVNFLSSLGDEDSNNNNNDEERRYSREEELPFGMSGGSPCVWELVKSVSTGTAC